MSQTPQVDSPGACDSRARRRGADPLWIIVLAGGAVMGLAIGIRHVQGLFLLPVSLDHGWSRETFGFAIALQNLMWGLGGSFLGAMAERRRMRRRDGARAGVVSARERVEGSAHALGSRARAMSESARHRAQRARRGAALRV